MTSGLTRTYFLKKAYIFILQNLDLYLIYLNIELILYGFTLLSARKIVPSYFSHFQFLLALFTFAYSYLFPVLVWKREHKEKISYGWFLKNFISLSVKLFFPLFFTVIIVLIPFIVFDFIFHAHIIKELNVVSKTGVGFYPIRGIIWFLIYIITSFFGFSAILYSLQHQGYFRSLKNSIFLTIKHFQFIFLLFFPIIFYSSIIMFFIPNNNYLVGIFNSLLMSTLWLLYFTAIYFFYTKHYSVKLITETRNKHTTLNTNVVYRRITAAVIDIFLWLLIFIIIASYFGHQMSISNKLGIKYKNFFSDNLDIVIILAETSYFILLEWLVQGTLGKKIMGIKVTSIDGTKASFMQIIIRNILRIADGFPFIIPYLTGLIVIAASNKKQRIGDKVAKTIVGK